MVASPGNEGGLSTKMQLSVPLNDIASALAIRSTGTSGTTEPKKLKGNGNIYYYVFKKSLT